MFRRSLTEIANLHGTDKGTEGPSAGWGAHGYTEVYEGYLSSARPARLSILEIGIGVRGPRWDARIVHGRNEEGGGSLKMWYEYFPHAQIFGMDVNDARHLDNDRIHTFVGDQGNPADLRRFLALVGEPQFDFIFDDGSHRPDHQQISFSLLFPRLRPGGVYFIEDLADNGLGDGPSGRHGCEQVHNTRKLLRQFRETGEFLQPNLLSDPGYLSEMIAEITFHLPKCAIAPENPDAGQAVTDRGVVRYESGTERLCAIRKK